MVKTYCLKERKLTENVYPKIVKTSNGRKIEESRYKGDSIDIHSKILPLLPKKGLTLPGYNYCGPGNPLDNRKPVNELNLD